MSFARFAAARFPDDDGGEVGGVSRVSGAATNGESAFGVVSGEDGVENDVDGGEMTRWERMWEEGEE